MLDGLLGDMNKSKEQMASRLAAIQINDQIQDGAVKISMTADRKVQDISIDDALMNVDQKEQLEDLIVELLNRSLDRIAQHEAAMSQEMLQSMIPPGMKGMLGL